MAGVLFIVSGPSGVGKGTLVKKLVNDNPSLALSVSCTTRAPRKGEKHGREYFFLTREEFENRLACGDFLESDEHFGNYYGTLKSFVKERLREKSVVLEIDVVGALNVKRDYYPAYFPSVVLIMVVTPDLETLEKRLSGRNSETEEERLGRLERVNYELSMQAEYDHVVVNDDLRKAYADLANIITEEIKKSERR